MPLRSLMGYKDSSLFPSKLLPVIIQHSSHNNNSELLLFQLISTWLINLFEMPLFYQARVHQIKFHRKKTDSQLKNKLQLIIKILLTSIIGLFSQSNNMPLQSRVFIDLIYVHISTFTLAKFIYLLISYHFFHKIDLNFIGNQFDLTH